MIRSLIGTSLIEYPGKISAVIFTGGCNLCCPFCHNPELVLPDLLSEQFSIPIDQVLENLIRRKGFIEAVTITGGEPLLFDGLEGLLRSIRSETDLFIKLDTNGTLPDTLDKMLPLLDYIAMDLKTSPGKYRIATGDRAGFEKVGDSVKMIRELPAYEFRTTMVPGIVDADDVEELLKTTGHIRRYVLQRFRSEKTLSPEFKGLPPYPGGYIEELAIKIELLADEIEIRV